ncbi:MAG: RDD family protein [Clostridia bacterium]|nr:RDD family protein [Clostridia bacterium]MDY6184532.1 RDD family protein [Eubacteriales bacterium]
MLDLQKASMWKRISAFLFDIIITGILIVGVAFLLSVILGYDGYSDRMQGCYDRYEAEYGVVFNITDEEYQTLTEEELQRYQEAYEALSADPEAVYAYNMLVNLTLVITSVSVLIGYLVLEFIIPLIFKNGQTLGKKIFGIGLMRTDGVRVSTVSLFIRTFLGKYTIETMVPALIVILIVFGSAGFVGTIILGLIALLELILVIATHTNSLIHDILAGTVAVDISSQMIFSSVEEMIEYKKKVSAEKAAKQAY